MITARTLPTINLNMSITLPKKARVQQSKQACSLIAGILLDTLDRALTRKTKTQIMMHIVMMRATKRMTYKLMGTGAPTETFIISIRNFCKGNKAAGKKRLYRTNDFSHDRVPHTDA